MHADHMVIILYLTWASILIRQGGILIYLTEVKYWCSFPMTENCLLKVKIFAFKYPCCNLTHKSIHV